MIEFFKKLFGMNPIQVKQLAQVNKINYFNPNESIAFQIVREEMQKAIDDNHHKMSNLLNDENILLYVRKTMAYIAKSLLNEDFKVSILISDNNIGIEKEKFRNFIIIFLTITKKIGLTAKEFNSGGFMYIDIDINSAKEVFYNSILTEDKISEINSVGIYR